MPEWIGEFQHDSITDANRGDFGTAMEKYESVEEAVVGGFNAQKAIGKPRLPKSMDELGDDVAKGEFTSGARSLLGIDIPKDTEALKDVNFKTGLADDAVVDEGFVGLVKNWAVEKGVDTASLGKMIELYNGPLAEFARSSMDAAEAAQLKESAEACQKDLVTHFGSAEKVAELSELLRRSLQNKAGLSAEEYEQVGESMATSILTKNSVVAKAMLNLLAPLSAEGSTDGGGGRATGEVKGITPYEYKKQQFPKSEGMWGKPDDKWENESIQLRKKAGQTE